MFINAELLLQYQRCQRRSYLDVRYDVQRRDAPTDLLIKLQNDRLARQRQILTRWRYSRPQSPHQDRTAAIAETIELMQRGTDCIYDGTLTIRYGQIPVIAEITEKLDDVDNFDNITLISNPDLLIKVPGKSRFGDWAYIPASIELGKRPKQEYQVVAAFHAQILAAIQGVTPKTALLMLRGKDSDYPVDLSRWIPQTQILLRECLETMVAQEAPEVFISRQKCSLCHWYSDCYATAQTQRHLSLLPGVTPGRYTQLQNLGITTPESLANANPELLASLPGFDGDVAPRLVLQAQSLLENRPLLLPEPLSKFPNGVSDLYTLANLRPQLGRIQEIITSTSEYEIYFDIEAQPDLNLNYLLGVLVVNRQNYQEQFYSFLAEHPDQEKSIWQDFLELMWAYPQAPVYHFCVYEFDTVKRLAQQYRTRQNSVIPVLNRFIDIYEELTRNVALPIESYALKAIARWLGFSWRDPEASGAKCIYWYDQWLKTGDRNLLKLIQRYNEDDCRATRSVKEWLVQFFQDLNV